MGAESSNLERLMFNLLLAELGGGALSPETGNTGTTYTMKTESNLKSGLHTYTPETHWLNRVLGTRLGIWQMPVNLYYLLSYLPWESGMNIKPTQPKWKQSSRCKLCRSVSLEMESQASPARLVQRVGEGLCIFPKEAKDPSIAFPNLSLQNGLANSSWTGFIQQRPSGSWPVHRRYMQGLCKGNHGRRSSAYTRVKAHLSACLLLPKEHRESLWHVPAE